MEFIGKAKYGLLDNGLFGVRIIAGIVTGVRFTEQGKMYELSFGKSSWWTYEVFDNLNSFTDKLQIISLDRVAQTHELKIKFDI